MRLRFLFIYLLLICFLNCDFNLFDIFHKEGNGNWNASYQDAKTALKEKDYDKAKQYFHNSIYKATNNNEKYLSFNGLATSQIYSDIEINTFFNAIKGIQQILDNKISPDDNFLPIIFLNEEERKSLTLNDSNLLSQKIASRIYSTLAKNYENIIFSNTISYYDNPIDNSPVINLLAAYTLAPENSIEQFEIANYYSAMEIMYLILRAMDTDKDGVFNEDGNIIFNKPNKDYFYITVFPELNIKYNLSSLDTLNNIFQPTKSEDFEDIHQEDVEIINNSIDEIFTAIDLLGLEYNNNTHFFNFILKRLEFIRSVLFLNENTNKPQWIENISIKPETFFGSFFDTSNSNSFYANLLYLQQKTAFNNIKQLKSFLIISKVSNNALLDFKNRFNKMPAYESFIENPMQFEEFRNQLINLSSSEKNIILNGITEIINLCTNGIENNLVQCLKQNNVLGFDIDDEINLPVNSIEIISEIKLFFENPEGYIILDKDDT